MPARFKYANINTFLRDLGNQFELLKVFDSTLSILIIFGLANKQHPTGVQDCNASTAFVLEPKKVL